MSTFTHDGITYTQSGLDVLAPGTRVIAGPSLDPQDPHVFVGMVGTVADDSWSEPGTVWVILDDKPERGPVPLRPWEVFLYRA